MSSLSKRSRSVSFLLPQCLEEILLEGFLFFFVLFDGRRSTFLLTIIAPAADERKPKTLVVT